MNHQIDIRHIRREANLQLGCLPVQKPLGLYLPSSHTSSASSRKKTPEIISVEMRKQIQNPRNLPTDSQIRTNPKYYETNLESNVRRAYCFRIRTHRKSPNLLSAIASFGPNKEEKYKDGCGVYDNFTLPR